MFPNSEKVNTATEVRGISRQSYAKSHWKKIAMAFPRQSLYLRRGQLDNHDCSVGQRNFNTFLHVGKTVEKGYGFLEINRTPLYLVQSSLLKTW